LLLLSPEPSVFLCGVKNLIIRINKSIILSLVPYGCEIWSLIIRNYHRLRVFYNRVLRRIFGQKRNKLVGRGGENCIRRSFVISALCVKLECSSR
jgi:hypothetical protein